MAGLGVGYKLNEASQDANPNYHYQPANGAGLPEGVPTERQAVPYQPNCQEPHYQSNSDLCAQWSAVEEVRETNRLARYALLLNYVAVFFGAVGTGLLLLTLRDTRRTSRSELRAYVFPLGLNLLDGASCEPPEPENENLPFCRIAIRNSGQTPAFDVIHWAEIAVLQRSDEHKLAIPALNKIGSAAVPPNGEIFKTVIYQRKISPEEADAIRSHSLSVFVHGRIEYTDVFGAKHVTNYRTVHSGFWPPTRGLQMLICDEGNKAD